MEDDEDIEKMEEEKMEVEETEIYFAKRSLKERIYCQTTIYKLLLLLLLLLSFFPSF